MSKKILWIVLIVVGLVAYCAYIVSILRPYFARVELEVAWELDYSSVAISGIHLGDAGTIFLITGEPSFIAISPDGQELYRHQIASQGYDYGYDGDSSDTMWLATMEYIDTSNLPQAGHYNQPAPGIQSPTSTGGTASGQSPYEARLVGITTASDKVVNQTFEVGGLINNLWCMGGKIYFKDTGQNLNCYDGQGNLLWVKNFPTMVDFSKGENLLFLDCGSEIVALNPEGDELWRTPIGQGAGLGDWPDWSTANGRLCLLDNNDAVHVLSFDGQEIWSVDLPYSFGSFGGYGYAGVSAKIHSDGTVYAMSRDATIRKYSAAGNNLWHFKVGQDPIRFDVGADGTVYTVEATKGLLAISAEGKLIWRDGHFRDYYYQSLNVGNNGLLYLVEYDKLIALELPGN